MSTATDSYKISMPGTSGISRLQALCFYCKYRLFHMSTRSLFRSFLSLAGLILVFTGCTSNEEPQQIEPLSVLLIDGQNNHEWKLTTPVLVSIFEESGRFTVDVLTSPARDEGMTGFNAPFSDYDVVVSNYNGVLWPEEMRNDFEEYVAGGGGFVPVHAADNAFPEWEAYNEMIGVGGWGQRNEESGPYLRLRNGNFIPDYDTPGRGGSHGDRHEFLIEARQPDHPIMQGLPSEWLHAEDELYDRMRGPALDLTVLASAFSEPDTRGTGEHEPMLMTIHYNQGRIFHTTLGHDVTAMSCVGFQTTLLRGAEWAATGEVTIPVPDDFPGSDMVSVRNVSEGSGIN